MKKTGKISQGRPPGSPGVVKTSKSAPKGKISNPNPVSLALPFPFPPAWLWLVDELIPTYVKKNFSPRDTWKDKPFSADDGRFFFKGIEELSELFTEDRPAGSRGLPDYFAHERNRCGYLLYFLPLQAAKFLSLFHAHSKAVDAAIRHSEKTGVLRVVDLGSGPGTASFALLLALMARGNAKFPAKIEFEWMDTSGKILEDGRKLMEFAGESFPLLRGRIQVKTRTGNWWEYPRHFSPDPKGDGSKDPSIIILGNVLNESAANLSLEAFFPKLVPLVERTSHGGAGVLLMEPAARRSSQLISQIRDSLFEEQVLESSAASIWGPCMHSGRCPLSEGRDWCHFSVPVEIPGKWFKQFSKGLGSERHWLKFSYFWLSSKAEPAPVPSASIRRVISDPIRKADGSGGPGFVLLCEPEEINRMTVGRMEKIYRGDVISFRTDSLDER